MNNFWQKRPLKFAQIKKYKRNRCHSFLDSVSLSGHCFLRCHDTGNNKKGEWSVERSARWTYENLIVKKSLPQNSWMTAPFKGPNWNEQKPEMWLPHYHRKWNSGQSVCGIAHCNKDDNEQRKDDLWWLVWLYLDLDITFMAVIIRLSLHSRLLRLWRNFYIKNLYLLSKWLGTDEIMYHHDEIYLA